MCSTEIADRHGHVADLEAHRLLCTCRACFLLFTGSGAGAGRFLAVPEDVRKVADVAISEGQWAALQIPVDLAFFLRQSGAENVGAYYPGPGARPSRSWTWPAGPRSSTRTPFWRRRNRDVRAILLRRSTSGYACYLVPVDRCYELVGIVRQSWVGFHGGAEVWARVEGFFAGAGRGEPPGRPDRRRGAPCLTSGSSTSSISGRRSTGPRPPRPCCCGCGSPRSSGTRVHAIALRTQVRVEPHRRRYDDDEAAALVDLFGSRGRWGQTLKPLQLAFVSHLVPSFTGSVETSLALPCSYDFDVAANKYLYSLAEGVAPLLLLFSGTWFSGTSGGLTVLPIPWDKEVTAGLPVESGEPRWTSTSRARRGYGWAGTPSTRSTGTAPRTPWFVGRGGHPAAQGGRRVTTFEDVRPLADTVLYEGYVLYPYRADDAKNRVRWQFGVLAPSALSAVDPSERSRLRAELLLDGRPGRVSLRVRFLQVQRRTVLRETAAGEEEVSRLEAGDTAYLPFDEAVAHELDLDVDLAPPSSRCGRPGKVPGGVDHERVPGGRLRRERLPLVRR